MAVAAVHRDGAGVVIKTFRGQLRGAPGRGDR